MALEAGLQALSQRPVFPIIGLQSREVSSQRHQLNSAVLSSIKQVVQGSSHSTFLAEGRSWLRKVGNNVLGGFLQAPLSVATKQKLELEKGGGKKYKEAELGEGDVYLI